MADPQSYRPKTSDIPAQPGVYRFLDEEGRVLYVGKAKSLRSRLVNYFQPLEKLHPRTQQMVQSAVRVVWVTVASETEALTLEYSWIKEFAPRFNVIFRDDKSYPYLAITTSEDIPRLMGTRAAHKKGDKYYGPYTKGSIRAWVDLLLKVFPVRSCSKGVLRQAQRSGRPCLNGYINRCVAPCVGRVPPAQYRALVNDLVHFLDSDGEQLIRQKTAQMREHASRQEYEQAAVLRDDIAALQMLVEKNTVVLAPNVDADVYGLEFDELEASVQVFYIRGGRIRGQRGWVSDIADLAGPELLEEMLVNAYGSGAQTVHAGPGSALTHAAGRDEAAHHAPTSLLKAEKTAPKYVDDVRHTATAAIPREIWLPAQPANKAALTEWLSELRGGPVQIKVPQRGDKAAFMQTVHANAQEALKRHKLQRTGDLTQRSQALEDLRRGLDLPRAPLRIECYDVSHTQGTYQVASMVVFEDGLPKKADYRKFTVRGPDGTGASDDTAAMNEVLYRRFSRLAAGAPSNEVTPEDAPDSAASKRDASEKAELANESVTSQNGVEPASESSASEKAELASHGPSAISSNVPLTAPRRFAYRPDLVVVDGGLPQVNAAQAAIAATGVQVPVIGLAKRLEEVWIPGEEFPLILPRQSAALHLLQYVRDESHRFAITYHRQKRSQAMTRSALDNVPGLGPAKQKALLKHFGSLAQIKQATPPQLQAVPGIGPALAQTIVTALSADA